MSIDATTLFSCQLQGLDASKASESTVDQNLIVTAEKGCNGTFNVLSRYGDSVWQLPNHWFPRSEVPARTRLDFSSLPKNFHGIVKATFFRYLIEGIDGFSKPRGSTCRRFFLQLVPFIRFLSVRHVKRLQDVTPELCNEYAAEQKKRLSPQSGKPLRPTSLVNIFLSVEHLHELTQGSYDPMPHPWPGSSSHWIAGRHKEDLTVAKTLIIPHKVISAIFSASVETLSHAQQWLTWRDELDEIYQGSTEKHSETARIYQNNFLRGQGYDKGLSTFRMELVTLRDSCMIIILIVSGIRVHELASLDGGYHKTIGDDGEIYYWLQGRSEKTHEGQVEWLVPEIAIRAVNVAKKLAAPLQIALNKHITELAKNGQNNTEATSLIQHQNALFLGETRNKGNVISTLSGGAILNRIRFFAKKHCVDWKFTPHQFRRTFAVYAAHNALGDLRYLKQHFKHWSIDMTVLYARNEKMDLDIVNDIQLAISNIKKVVIENALERETLLSGGMGKRFIALRSNNEAVVTYGSRKEMINLIAKTVHLRATGVAWCMNDSGGCGGGGPVDRTQCAECDEALISKSHLNCWEAIYSQQIELCRIDDIGEGGKRRVERDLERCEQVLSKLGANVPELRQKYENTI